MRDYWVCMLSNLPSSIMPLIFKKPAVKLTSNLNRGRAPSLPMCFAPLSLYPNPNPIFILTVWPITSLSIHFQTILGPDDAKKALGHCCFIFLTPLSTHTGRGKNPAIHTPSALLSNRSSPSATTSSKTWRKTQTVE